MPYEVMWMTRWEEECCENALPSYDRHTVDDCQKAGINVRGLALFECQRCMQLCVQTYFDERKFTAEYCITCHPGGWRHRYKKEY
jgi:hypothetical protein